MVQHCEEKLKEGYVLILSFFNATFIIENHLPYVILETVVPAPGFYN